MQRKSIRISTIIILFLLLFSLCIGQFINNDAINPIAEAATYTETIEIISLSDLRYYPTYYCYNGSLIGSDYEKFLSTNNSLLVESSLILKEALRIINLRSPRYLVISGGLSLNGERQGLIDVANALRKLQNDVRLAGNSSFQIFVVPGSNDLYNPNAMNYSTYAATEAQWVSASEFAFIFSSLGYPDVNDNEAQIFYQDSEWNNTSASLLPYTPLFTNRVFINSTTANGVNIEYMSDNYEFYTPNDLSYIATTNKGYTFIGLDTTQSSASFYNKRGALSIEALDWLQENRDALSINTHIAFAHHSLIPSFSLQENYANNYIVNNWEYIAEFIADYGIRYAFTGNMLANDVAYYASYKNNTLSQLSTGSIVSLTAAYRVNSISRIMVDDNLRENFTTRINSIMSVDLTKLFDENYLDDSITINNNTLWGNQLMSYICTNLPQYIRVNSFNSLLLNIVENMITPQLIDNLTITLKENDIIKSLGVESLVDKIVDNLISEIEIKLLDTYTYTGTNNNFTGGKNKLLAYITETILAVLKEPIVSYEGANYTLNNIIMYAYTTYLTGGEVDNLSNAPQWYQRAIAALNSGDAVYDMFNVVLNKSGFYENFLTLLTTELNLSLNLNTVQKNLVSTALIIINKSTDIERVKIADILPGLIQLLNIDIEINPLDVKNSIDFMLMDNYNEGLRKGLGGIMSNILVSLSVDSTTDGAIGVSRQLKFKNTDVYTYAGESRTDIFHSVNDGRLPSMLTLTFGEDPTTTKNMVWFTNKAITGTDIRIVENSNNNGNLNGNNVKYISGITEIYAYSYPLLDFGYFSTFTTKEIAKHTIELSNLKPNTEYLYIVGSARDNLWSPAYTFKTAPNTNAPFELLLVSDMQGIIESSYIEINNILENSSAVFNNGYDFIVNLGDIVENSNNMNQWKYAINSSYKIYAGTTTVPVVGNHEKAPFTPQPDYVPSSESVVTEPYNNLLRHYNINFPEQNSLNGVYYSFDYSGVHFVVLNTNDIVNNDISPAQLEWLIEDLSTTSKKHKVVFMHRGIYTAGIHSREKEIINMRNTLTPIFSNQGVSVVFQGHDHVYSESYYINAQGKPVKGWHNGGYEINNKNGGVLYVNLGTVGNKYYTYMETENVPIFYGAELHSPTLSNPTFGKLVYDGEKLYYQGYQYNHQTNTITAIGADSTFTLRFIMAGAVIFIGFASVMLNLGIKNYKFYRKMNS